MFDEVPFHLCLVFFILIFKLCKRQLVFISYYNCCIYYIKIEYISIYGIKIIVKSDRDHDIFKTVPLYQSSPYLCVCVCVL